MTSTADVEFVVRVIAETAVAQEQYFGDLDSVVGDGDFGFSLARGFEQVIAGWDDLPRESPTAFLRKVAMIVTSRVGGTSGPLWGTAFLRAATAANEREDLAGADVVAMLRAAIEGIMARGSASLGDKTLLDALAPLTDSIEESLPLGLSFDEILAQAATRTRDAAEATSALQARRGRASYTGERSIGSPDAGAIAIAVMVEQLAARSTER